MVAKGHDIPNVTAVGIISADTALNMPDFRAAERCFMLITQAAGRAGWCTLSPGGGARMTVYTVSRKRYTLSLPLALHCACGDRLPVDTRPIMLPSE